MMDGGGGGCCHHGKVVVVVVGVMEGVLHLLPPLPLIFFQLCGCEGNSHGNDGRNCNVHDRKHGGSDDDSGDF